VTGLTVSGVAPASAGRPLPLLTPETEFFWTAGASGTLRFLRCVACGYFVHPPGPRCPKCLTRSLQPTAVSGRGTVLTFTVNYQPWYPGLATPYLVAVVGLVEQDDLRLLTNLVGCEPGDVAIGIPVEVTFAAVDDVHLPFFRPVG
jgi:hypothetical protein